MGDRQATSDQGKRSGPDIYKDMYDEGKDGLGSFNGAKTDQQADKDQGKRSKGDAC